ncbi:MAG: dihydrodipicolinate synthase family protein [Zhongshania sp.]|uniref:dihydrodipicolinate synthase family protein n=1 Tax=Zhongshania sp. TaxID=1971902 RepID=UPI002606F24B|nr:dihydrodipicolinate synthase family protein [Zhongshania sp.]MDF1692670.1 dihydrodipicolinate synthase family protein [Zhongshania sp.]
MKGIIVDLITPTHANGAPDYETLEILVDWHVENGSSALLVGSSTGHPAALNIEERTELLRRAIWQADSRIPIIADLGDNSNNQAFEFASIADEYGASALLFTAAATAGCSQNEILENVRTLAGAAKRPLIVRANFDHPNSLSPSSVADLAQISGISGFVDGSTNSTTAQELLSLKLPIGFALYAGHDASACQQILMGYRGSLSIAANVNPAQLQKLYSLAQAGDRDGAIALDLHLQALYSALLEDPNSIPLKWALVEMGCIPEGEHPPSLGQASDYSNLRRALRAAQIPI